VNAVNRVTKQTTGTLRQFVVTADVATGATSIPIYPAIVPGGPDYVPVHRRRRGAVPDRRCLAGQRRRSRC
jgi:hypothetical protein